MDQPSDTPKQPHFQLNENELSLLPRLHDIAKELELLRAEQKGLLSHMRQGVIGVTMGGVIHLVSDAALDILQYEKQALIGKPLNEFMISTHVLPDAHRSLLQDNPSTTFIFKKGSGGSVTIECEESFIRGTEDLYIGAIIIFQHVNLAPDELKKDLPFALERKEFILYYQPQFDLQADKIVGFEVLLRWNHSKLGLIFPKQFLPALNESPILHEVGRWVLEEAVKEYKTWLAAGLILPTVSLAINISRQALMQPEYALFLENTISTHQINATRIEIELSEGDLMPISDVLIERLKALRAIGVRIVLDNFGQSGSPDLLQQIKQLPVDAVKMDHSFVEGLNNQDTELMNFIEGLHVDIQATHIETSDQINALHQREYISAQGYYFSQPLPAKEMTLLLQQTLDTSV